MNDATKTLFQEEAEDYQKEEHRTKEDALSFAKSIIVASGILLALWGIGYLFLKDSKHTVAMFLLVLSSLAAIGVVVGLVFLISGTTRPTKVVTCPKCSAKHEIYKNVKNYMCTNCRTLLLLSEDDTGTPQFSACPYCGLETAVEADHGRFLCSNCGIIRHSGSKETWEGTDTCSTCKQPLPDHAIYCTHCGSIQISDFSQPVKGDNSLAYDEDWEIGKNATGHLRFAKALLRDTQDKTQKAENIKDIKPLLASLEKPLVSLEEALQDPNIWPSVQDMIPDIDLVYAAILERVTVILQATDPKHLKKGQVTWSEPHMPARRRVEHILGESLASSNGIGLWEENLVRMESFDTRDIRGERTTRERISNYKRLIDEKDRFAAWIEERSVQ